MRLQKNVIFIWYISNYFKLIADVIDLLIIAVLVLHAFHPLPMVFCATLSTNYDKDNDKLQELSYYMKSVSKILLSFFSNTKYANRVLQQRENV